MIENDLFNKILHANANEIKILTEKLKKRMEVKEIREVVQVNIKKLDRHQFSPVEKLTLDYQGKF